MSFVDAKKMRTLIEEGIECMDEEVRGPFVEIYSRHLHNAADESVKLIEAIGKNKKTQLN